MEVVTVQKYVAEDGKVFEKEKECVDYENEIKKVKQLQDAINAKHKEISEHLEIVGDLIQEYNAITGRDFIVARDRSGKYTLAQSNFVFRY